MFPAFSQRRELAVNYNHHFYKVGTLLINVIKTEGNSLGLTEKKTMLQYFCLFFYSKHTLDFQERTNSFNFKNMPAKKHVGKRALSDCRAGVLNSNELRINI